MKLVALPFSTPGVYFLYLLLNGIFGGGHIDFDVISTPGIAQFNPSTDEIGLLGSLIVIFLIMVPSLGFGGIAFFGVNKLTVDDEKNLATFEFILLKTFRRQTWKLKKQRGVRVSYNRRKGGWIVSLSNTTKPLAITAREKSARIFALTAAKRMGATLNGIENEKIFLSLGQRLIGQGKADKIPTKRKGVIISVESRTDYILLRNPPTLSIKIPLASIALILIALWYTLWPAPVLPKDELFIILILLTGLSVFIVRLIFKFFAHEVFELIITLSPGSINIRNNFRLFARSKVYATDEIRDVFKSPTGIALVSDTATTYFAEGVATIDRTFICNYIKYWLIHEV